MYERSLSLLANLSGMAFGALRAILSLSLWGSAFLPAWQPLAFHMDPANLTHLSVSGCIVAAFNDASGQQFSQATDSG